MANYNGDTSMSVANIIGVPDYQVFMHVHGVHAVNMNMGCTIADVRL
ncbi:MAG TPA: hypothetical protein VF679_00290 [Pedobacter sp.]